MINDLIISMATKVGFIENNYKIKVTVNSMWLPQQLCN